MRRLLLVIACVCWVTPVAAQRPTVHTTVQTTATTASSLLVGCALGATTGCTGGINSGPIVVNSGGINIVSNVPGDTTMKLYNNSGTLTWNGTPLAAGSSLSGTTGTIAIFTASNAVGDSIITQTGGNTITVTGTLNATTAIQLNGASLNTAGTLSNVAYLNAANTFSNASGQTFAGGIGLSGGSPSTHGIMIPSAVPGITTTNLYNNGGVLTWSGGASFPGNVTVTTLNTYTFNQSVASGASPTLTGTNFTGIPASGVSSGTFAGSTAAVFGGTLAWGGGSAISSSGAVALLAGATFTGQVSVDTATGDPVLWGAIAASPSYTALSFNNSLASSSAMSGIFGRSAGTDSGALYYAVPVGQSHTWLGNGNVIAILSASGVLTVSDNVIMSATKKLYLDGGGDSYITETTANVVRIYAGGTDVVIAKSDGLYLGLVPTTASAANMYYNTSTARVEYSTSSLRYKHDIDTLDADHALSAVMAMRPVTYRGKTDDDQRRYVGFIAEEVMEIAPLLATYDEGGESGTPNYVTYDRVTAYLVAVVQKQQAEINALKAQMKEKQ